MVDKEFFHKREFSFTIQDDIYIRYQCFRTVDEMREAIIKRQPHKIDIGAVFNALPKDHSTIKQDLFKTVERELVFDIDMTDYDSVRTCCDGANICLKCWPYMTMALKVVDEILRIDFAFKHILWIYSGRRGIHCWVCDSEARELSNEARSAIVEYMSVDVGTSDNSDKKLKTSFKKPFHPLIRRAYDVLEPYFERFIVDGQKLLTQKESYMKILNSLPNESIRVELFNEWEKQSSNNNNSSNNNSRIGLQRWKQIKEKIIEPMKSSINQTTKRIKIDWNILDEWRYELIFTHCYPRLDANVSKSQNHLLKSPFCVHPKTGRVCVPIDPLKADEFDPFTVPTVRTLCQEVRNLFNYQLLLSKIIDYCCFNVFLWVLLKFFCVFQCFMYFFLCF